MSGFLRPGLSCLKEYTPGEQPRDRKYIKLNTNESPYPPSKGVLDCLTGGAARELNLYPDPTGLMLKEKLAARYGVGVENICLVNGSDEALNFAFMAFCDETRGVMFPDISYGFYQVFADLYGIPATTVPLKDDFSIDYRDYLGAGRTVVIANPNAPTGMALPLADIENILKGNTDNVVLIDEAYVDFGGESCIPLTAEYDNLLVVQTYSKSRSMAGARLGYAIASPALIKDLEKIKYSTNPYNINRLTMAAGAAAIDDDKYYKENAGKIIVTRERTAASLREMGFIVLPSRANFIFARHAGYSGDYIYGKLKEKGILVRHFASERIKDFVRVTIGTPEQMERLEECLREIVAG